MNVFSLWRRRGSAPVARERLQILLSYERRARGESNLLSILRGDILAAVSKHLTIDQDNIVIRMDRDATLSTLEIEIVIPDAEMKLAAS
jgi:cell division topological specificity factor